jgi:hypothetical protein
MASREQGEQSSGIRRRDLLAGAAVLGLGGVIGAVQVGRAPGAASSEVPASVGPDETIDPGDIPDEFPNLTQEPQIFFTDLEIP